MRQVLLVNIGDQDEQVSVVTPSIDAPAIVHFTWFLPPKESRAFPLEPNQALFIKE